MLFSATNTEKTKALTSLALKKEPVYVGVDDTKELATVEGLEQGYVVCPSEKRLLVLFTFLKKNRKKKVMVFFSSCMSVKFYHELFNYIDLPVMCIHVSNKNLDKYETETLKNMRVQFKILDKLNASGCHLAFVISVMTVIAKG